MTLLTQMIDAVGLWLSKNRRARYERMIQREAEEYVRYCEKQTDLARKICEIERKKWESPK